MEGLRTQCQRYCTTRKIWEGLCGIIDHAAKWRCVRGAYLWNVERYSLLVWIPLVHRKYVHCTKNHSSLANGFRNMTALKLAKMRLLFSQSSNEIQIYCSTAHAYLPAQYGILLNSCSTLK